MTRPNPRLAKLHRDYTEAEIARLFKVHRNTVRNWRERGLPAIDDYRPAMIRGKAVRAFLEAERAHSKRPCPPGTIYCCKCRAPRPPAAGSVVFEMVENGSGNMRAICADCGTRMFQRARQSRISGKLPGIPVRVVEASGHIKECPPPSLNCLKSKD